MAGMIHMGLKSPKVVIDDLDNAFLGRRGSTYGWSAPETYVDKGQLEPGLEVLQQADIYPFGVLLWEVLTRREVDVPIGIDHTEFFKIDDILEHEEYVKLMRRCLQPRPSDRSSLAEIITILENLESKIEWSM